MFPNRKGPPPGLPPPPQTCPSDSQAREKLALYVYEYLIHTGAKQAAETFLKEINWQNQNIAVSDAPGFLQTWWCVFWDLYCAAPERRDRESCEHSAEAKAFHDYGLVNSGAFMMNGLHQNATPSPLGMGPGGDGIPSGSIGPLGGHPGFFQRPSPSGGPVPPASQASPISGHPPPGFVPGQRFSGVRSGPNMVRMVQDPGMVQFGPPGGHPDQLRPPGMMHHPQRLPPSGGPPMRLPNANFPGMRPVMQMQGMSPHWRPNTSMHYSESSAIGQYPSVQGVQMLSNGPIPCSTTSSIMSSPGAALPPDMPPDSRYMPLVVGGGMSSSFAMCGPESAGGVPPNELLLNGEDVKNSPASLSAGAGGAVGGGGTPGPGSQHNNGPHGGPGSAAPGSVHSQGNNDSMDYSASSQHAQGDDEQNEIAKIKQSMMEDIKGFEPKQDDSTAFGFD